jgi:hypothetical protein
MPLASLRPRLFNSGAVRLDDGACRQVELGRERFCRPAIFSGMSSLLSAFALLLSVCFLNMLFVLMGRGSVY